VSGKHKYSPDIESYVSNPDNKSAYKSNRELSTALKSHAIGLAQLAPFEHLIPGSASSMTAT